MSSMKKKSDPSPRTLRALKRQKTSFDTNLHPISSRRTTSNRDTSTIPPPRHRTRSYSARNRHHNPSPPPPPLRSISTKSSLHPPLPSSSPRSSPPHSSPSQRSNSPPQPSTLPDSSSPPTPDPLPHVPPPPTFPDFAPFTSSSLALTLNPSFTLSSSFPDSPSSSEQPQSLVSTTPVGPHDFFPSTAPSLPDDDNTSERRGENIWKLACKRRVGFLYRQYTPQTIRAVVAAQAESESYLNPSRTSSHASFPDADEDEDDDEEDECDEDGEYEYEYELTALDGERQVDIRSFNIHGFSDFELDLNTFANPASHSPSSPSSPPPTSSAALPTIPPLPATPDYPRIGPSTPLASLFSSTAPSLPFPPPRLSTLPVTALRDDAWPRVMGRGTPVDHQRRAHWADPYSHLRAGLDRDENCARRSNVSNGGSVASIELSSTGVTESEWSQFLENLLSGPCTSSSASSLAATTQVHIDGATGVGSTLGMNVGIIGAETPRVEVPEGISGDVWFQWSLGSVPVGGGDTQVQVPVQMQTQSPLNFALG